MAKYTDKDFVTFVQKAVGEVKTSADIEELTRLKKLFKQYTPFLLRNYAAAYLARECLEHSANPRVSEERQDSCRPTEKSAQRNESADRDRRFAPPRRALIGKADSEVVYISIGRNNRCFVRDLLRLLMNTGGLPRERIGDIRLFDTYSFVQLYAEDALRVIKALDGYVYQGRSLVANIARQREDAETRSSGAPEPAHNRPADLPIEAEQANTGASDASVQVAVDAEIAAADCNAETVTESNANADSEAREEDD